MKIKYKIKFTHLRGRLATMFKMQLLYISEIFVQYFYIMMNDFQCQQLVIFWIATNKEKEAGVSIGLLDTKQIVQKEPFEDNSLFFPLKHVAVAGVSIQNHCRHLPHDARLVLICVGRIPFREPRLALSVYQQHEVQHPLERSSPLDAFQGNDSKQAACVGQ